MNVPPFQCPLNENGLIMEAVRSFKCFGSCFSVDGLVDGGTQDELEMRASEGLKTFGAM